MNWKNQKRKRGKISVYSSNTRFLILPRDLISKGLRTNDYLNKMRIKEWGWEKYLMTTELS